MNTDTARSEQVELSFLIKWILASTVGWSVIIAIGLVSTSPPGPLGLGREWYIKDGLIKLVMFFPGGAIAGILQWFTLRGKLTQLGSWVVAPIWVWSAIISFTLGYYAISWLMLTMFIEVSMMEVSNAVFILALGGLALTGFPQWLVLRRYVSKVSGWMLIVPFGILVGYFIWCMGGIYFYDISLEIERGAIPGVVGGLIYGLITAIALSLQLRPANLLSPSSEQDDN